MGVTKLPKIQSLLSPSGLILKQEKKPSSSAYHSTTDDDDNFMLTATLSLNTK